MNKRTLKLAPSEHPMYPGETYDSCDLCTRMAKPYRIWSPQQLGYANMGDAHAKDMFSTGADFFILCIACHTLHKDRLESDAPIVPITSNIESYATLDEYLAQEAGRNTVYHGNAPKATPVVPVKCMKAHWTQIKGPKGYGYLRLASERGGKYIDVDCDYGLGFSTGWNDIVEKPTIIWQPGSKTPPPSFTVDRSNWPGFAFIDWADMSPPDEAVTAYVPWAAKQWKQGKNIQFGCYGAHGRTGTFLALLYLETGICKTAEAAIDKVHLVHCIDAIETKGQKDAIAKYAARPF